VGWMPLIKWKQEYSVKDNNNPKGLVANADKLLKF
jgi:hypothetical protein